SEEESISILRGIKERFDAHHGVRIQDNAIVAAVKLSSRYIADRFLPDKAIDLMDEAAAMVKTQLASMPEELDSLTRRLLQYRIEEKALKSEKDEKSRERLKALREDIAGLSKQVDAMKAQWDERARHIAAVRAARDRRDDVRRAIEQAEAAYDLNKAAELKYKTLRDAEAKLQAEEEKATRLRAAAEQAGDGGLDATAFNEEVTEDEIAEVVSRWTGIPVTRLRAEEKDKLLNLPS